MEKLWPFLIAATGLWTTAVALAIATTITGSITWALWSALVAMKGSIVSLWAISEYIACRERLRVDTIADLILHTAPQKPVGNVEPIRH